MRLRKYTVVWTDRDTRFETRHRTMEQAMGQIGELHRDGLTYDEFQVTSYNVSRALVYLVAFVVLMFVMRALWSFMAPVNSLDLIALSALAVGMVYTVIQIVREI